MSNGSLAASPHAADVCGAALAVEKRRISIAISYLEAITRKLNEAGCAAVVIKSLDHYPDLGSDLDLFSAADEEQIVSVMGAELHAEGMARSWGDRGTAHKFNFQVPGLPEAVEIHIGVLGQTGEHINLAKRVSENAIAYEVEERSFRVAAPEERIMISTLQRMYRHFYFRLCDIVDTKTLIEHGKLNFDGLRRGAEPNGIWPGVATFLEVVAEYCHKYGAEIKLPAEVLSSAHSSAHGLPQRTVPPHSNCPDATGLYFRQWRMPGEKPIFAPWLD